MVTVKSYAKLNICLKITGVENGYHMLESAVMTVDKYDVITVKKRKDNKILVSFTGKYAFTPKFQEQTNAYKSAKLFMDTFKTSGVEVTVKRNIPDGSGMGSSSADIVGVLNAMKKLFKVDKDILPLANSLGSDCAVLLNGGFSKMKNRGELVESLKTEHNYYFVVIHSKSKVGTKECFDLYDKEFSKESKVNADLVCKGIADGDIDLIKENCGNDLYYPAIKLNPEIEKNLNVLKSLSPDVCLMTGSGSSCFSMYKEYEMASWAYEKLKKSYNVELLSYFNPNEQTFFQKLFNKNF